MEAKWKRKEFHAFHKPFSRVKVPFSQPVSGFPKYPGRHLQMPLWNSDMQLAFGPHPILLHARIQDPWWQVSFLLQSWSLTHCGLASTVKQKWFMHLKKQVTMSKVTSFTIATISSKCAFWTNTCNTSYRCLCVSDNTLLGWRTWVAHNTRIQASFSHAGELWRTVSINSAFWFFWYHRHL